MDLFPLTSVLSPGERRCKKILIWLSFSVKNQALECK
jgi:hypothetical protein